MTTESCFKCGATTNLGRRPINSGRITCAECDLAADVERKLSDPVRVHQFNPATGRVEAIDVPEEP
jgi:hypothetical protein